MSPLLRVTIFFAIYLLATAYALRCGGGPERRAAVIMTASLLATWLLISSTSRRFHGPEYGVAAVDTLMLIGVVWLALTADRFWTLWVAAMQTVVVLSHAAMILKPYTLPTYYKNTIQLWSYPILGLLAVGTLRHRLRTRPSRLEAWLGHKACALRRLAEHGRSRVVHRGSSAGD